MRLLKNFTKAHGLSPRDMEASRSREYLAELMCSDSVLYCEPGYGNILNSLRKLENGVYRAPDLLVPLYSVNLTTLFDELFSAIVLTAGANGICVNCTIPDFDVVCACSPRPLITAVLRLISHADVHFRGRMLRLLLELREQTIAITVANFGNEFLYTPQNLESEELSSVAAVAKLHGGHLIIKASPCGSLSKLSFPMKPTNGLPPYPNISAEEHILDRFSPLRICIPQFFQILG